MRQSLNRIERQLVCEQLQSRELMAADIVPEMEPNNSESQPTTFAFAVGQHVRLQGTSQSKDDKDFFAFTAPTAMQIKVNASDAHGAKLEVTTRAGAQLLETEPKDGLVTGKWQAQAGETYLLRMRSTEKTAAAYDVLVEATEGSSTGGANNGGNNGGSGSTSAGPEVEPNDRTSSATQTNLDASQTLTLTGSASKRDRDFFRVQPAGAGLVAIDTGNSGIKVSIETATGAKLFESEPRDGVTSGTFRVSAGDAFFVRARGLGSSVTQYSLTLTLSGSSSANSIPSSSTNSSSPDAWLDSSDDGLVTALDALLVINHLNAHGAGHGADDVFLNLDTNDDRLVSALDALLVVNRVNDSTRGADVNDAFDDSDLRRKRGQ